MNFIKSVFQTMRETTWLNGRETRRDTTTVVATSLFFIAFFAIADYCVQLVLSLLA
ncbi:preprotein translocase subunit SecE [Ligilactobacillus ceti]|uniref:Preprotein translocase subunit SecE n=1 Tax=Ligilactobacillus ceti DSM 22408 TaxID=1122146 RepID=A0A0R2KQD2_9LACO|nr:preprotein translocase subunit SecE [Ligilactobacillus ceti]KRN88461.1 hypothetical protein IV53_GL000425 [Ligilactobacillus ceti DSM 22408]